MIIRCVAVLSVILVCSGGGDAKLLGGNRTNNNENTKSYKAASGSGLLFAEELRVTLERYLFGICPHSFKLPMTSKAKNTTMLPCDLDAAHNDLAARLATLSLRAHSASRASCSELGALLAATFGELARTAAHRQGYNATDGTSQSDSNKKRKLSKSQKAKIQAKQRTALAVKKKAAAAAAAAASKVTA